MNKNEGLIGVGEDALLQLTNKLRINSLHPRELTTRLWYVVCALRGPDSGDELLKNHFTGPIRAWVSRDWNIAIGSTTSSKVLTLTELVALKEEATKIVADMEFQLKLNDNKDPNHHYLGHICLALNVIIEFERNKAEHEKVTS